MEKQKATTGQSTRPDIHRDSSHQKFFLEEMQKFQKRFRQGMEILTSPLNTEVGVTPKELVYEEDKMKVFRYIPVSPVRNHSPEGEGGRLGHPISNGVKEKLISPPVLIAYAMVNRQYMLDLQPDRSVIRYMLDQGLDVYIIDWGYPSPGDKFNTLEDYIEGYLHNAVNHVLRRAGVAQLNLMGICQGGTFCVMYSALHPEKVKNLVTIVTPVDFDTDTGLLNVWSRSLDVDKMVNTYGNIPGDFMNIGFLLLNPFRLMFDKYVGFMEHLDDKEFINNFIRMEKWIFDSPNQAGECFRQFIKDCYQKNLLIQNKLKVGEATVNLKNITMPVLNIFAEYDTLVPPACSRNFTDHIGSKDKEAASFQTGHIGIFVSSRSQKEICPRLTGWLAAHSEGGAKTGEKSKTGESK